MSTIIATPSEDTRELREQVLRMCFKMRDELRYFIGTWGNISVRLTDGILATPTRVHYELLAPEDLVVVDWDGQVIRGVRRPTSEIETHRQLFLERADFGAIIHTHSPWATVCAVAHRSIPVLSDEMAEVVGGEIRVSPHVPAGRHREMALAARATIGPDACAVLLGNHGVMAGGRDLEEACVCAQAVERAALMQIHAGLIGGALPIAEPLWREERHRYLFKYGTAADFEDSGEEDRSCVSVGGTAGSLVR